MKQTKAAGQETISTMLKESDRGALLVGLSQVDYLLGKLIYRSLTIWGSPKDARWLLDQKAGNRPLASLAVRTRFARAMGLISVEMRNVIDALRGLRNMHAHGTAHFELCRRDLDQVLGALTEHRSMVNGLIREGARKWKRESLAGQQLMATISLVIIYLSIHLSRLQEDVDSIESKGGLNGEVEGDHSPVEI